METNTRKDIKTARTRFEKTATVTNLQYTTPLFQQPNAYGDVLNQHSKYISTTSQLK